MRYLLMLLIALATPVVFCADPPAIQGKRGMVVAGEPHAVDVGVAILEAGGNAVDAAVAVGFALAVTLPEAGNLGGGGFLVASIHGADGNLLQVALDFREVAPAAAHERLYVDARERGRENSSTVGPLAAGVPGSVAGMLDALERWGTLDRATVLAPAIRLAEEGFPIAAPTARLLALPSVSEQMMKSPSTRRVFYPAGEPLAAGETLRQPDLARTLKSIATKGRAGFYAGPVAAAIVAEMQRGDGLITARDLAVYKPRVRTPVSFRYRDHTIISMPPPSSGGVCLQQMLGMLERFPLASLGQNSSTSLHLVTEAMRRSFADRNRFLGDPDHHELPLERLVSREHIATLSATIDARWATPSAQILAEDTPMPEEREETTHYSIVDAKHNAVSVTTTLNGAFGAKVVVDGAGFLLNNEMDDFTAEPGKPNIYGLVQGRANAVTAGARPLSSMTPTIVLDSRGELLHVLGSPGGPTIITNVLQVLLNLIEYGMAPQAAVNAPKIHHQCLPDRLFHEQEFPVDVLRALQERGHTLAPRDWIGDLHLITVESHGLLGAADPRRGGVARGL